MGDWGKSSFLRTNPAEIVVMRKYHMHYKSFLATALLLAFLTPGPITAGDNELTAADIDRMLNPEGRVVILGAGRDYDVLLRHAQAISRKSGIKIYLMGRTYNAKKGWVSRDEGDGPGGYFLRNVSDGGGMSFISIEASDAYPGLKKGYFIIVGDISLSPKEAAASLDCYRRSVADAYIAKATIFIGCRH